MPKIKKVYGSPGTGKTSYLIDSARNSYTGLYIVFNKSMQEDAKLRFPNSIEVKTLHSLCYELLELDDKDIFTNKEIVDFMNDMGIDMENGDVDQEEGYFNSTNVGGRILMSINKSRNNFQPIEPVDGFDGDIYELYHKYRDSMGARYDFTRMIEDVAFNQNLSAYPYNLYIDEAQDLTPLQWIVVKRLIENTSNEVIIAGDDYQKIYTMLGVMDDFYNFKADEEIVLNKSYRMNRAVYNFSNKLSKMMINIKPRELEVREGGLVEYVDYETMLSMLNQLIDTNKKVFILTRTKFNILKIGSIGGIANDLIENGIPFLSINPSHAGFSPWSSDEFIEKYNTAIELFTKGSALRDRVVKLAKHFPVEDPKNIHTSLRKGIKSKITSKTNNNMLDPLITFNEFKSWFTTPVDFQDVVREAFTDRQKRVINAVGLNAPTDKSQIHIYLDTIHSVKGLEADIVFIDVAVPDRIYRMLTSPDPNDVSDEYKVWYVGATRAKDELYFFNSGLFNSSFPIDEYL